MSYINELERKIGILQTDKKYLSEQNLRLQTSNMKLRVILYGAANTEHLPTIAHEVINGFFDVELDTRSRALKFVQAREHYYAYLRQNTKMSLKEIANSISLNFDHSTLVHSLKNFEMYYQTEKKYKMDHDRICLLIEKQIQSNQP